MYRLFPFFFLLSAAPAGSPDPGPLPFPVTTVRVPVSASPPALGSAPTPGVEAITWTVAEVPLADLLLVGQAPRDPHRFDDLVSHLSARQLRPLLAMNAGIFESPTEPTGLFVEDGVERHPLNRSTGAGNFFWAPNGVFWVDARGAHVAATARYAPGPGLRLATQSGPLLLEDGVPHPGASRSTSRHTRNGVGVRPDGTVLFAISDAPATFPEMIALFRETLHCDDVLYLDGTISDLCLGDACARRSREWAGMLVLTAPLPPG